MKRPVIDWSFSSYKNFYASEVNIKIQGHRQVILYCTMKTCLL